MGKIIDFSARSNKFTDEQIEQQLKRFCARVGISFSKLSYEKISDTEIKVTTNDEKTKEALRVYGIELHDTPQKS